MDKKGSGLETLKGLSARMMLSANVESINEAVDIIRRDTESCKCQQGFQLMQSITGSGMGTQNG